MCFGRLEDDEVYGMFVLEAALSLILTDSLPPEIVQKIFSVNFLEKLDAEVLRSYDKVNILINEEIFINRFINLFYFYSDPPPPSNPRVSYATESGSLHQHARMWCSLVPWKLLSISDEFKY